MRSALLIPLLLVPICTAFAWEQIELPSADQATPTWYRCRIQVPDRLVVPEGNNPRDLWRSSTMLVLGDLPEGTEVFLNGIKIITTDAVPSGQSKRYKVPKDILVDQAALSFINPPTAYCLLKELVDLKPGSWVVQNAGNSAVGLSIIQMAQAVGFKTISQVRRRIG